MSEDNSTAPQEEKKQTSWLSKLASDVILSEHTEPPLSLRDYVFDLHTPTKKIPFNLTRPISGNFKIFFEE